MRPNFLFLFPDQHRGDWLPYEDEVFLNLKTEAPPIEMPNIKKLMNNGVTFYRCITSSPLCAPARACLASGWRYENCGVLNNKTDYPPQLETFYGRLKEAGYSVGGVGKFDLHKKTLFWGLDGWTEALGEIGFTHAIDSEGKWDGVTASQNEPKGPYFKYLYDNNLQAVYLDDMKKRKGAEVKYNSDATKLPEEAYGDNWIGRNAVEMLSQFPQDRPWFLQVNFSGPHEPWDITQSMKKAWEGVQFPKAERGAADLEESVNSIRQNYAAMLQNIDRITGLLLDELIKRNELDNTIIVYSSDHGEMLGDLDLLYKKRPDRASIHIPLVVSGCSVIKNAVSDAFVELNDLSATFLDYAGLGADFNESKSIKPILSGNTSYHRESAESAFGDWKVVCSGRFKTVYRNGEPEAKYDIIDDPWERINLL